MIKLNTFDKISIFLILLGSLIWGVIGIFSINPVRLLTGNVIIFERIIYIIFFLAAINLIYSFLKSTTIFSDKI